MPFAETILANWKYLLSWTRREWRFSDYPVRVREVESSDHDRYQAQIVNWWVMNALGPTPAAARAALAATFELVMEDRRREGKAMPRPGVEAPIEFAPSDRVNANPELLDDFILKILGVSWAFVSDGSSLSDLHDEPDDSAYHERILETYGVDVSDIESGNLAEILERIAQHQRKTAKSE